MLHGCCEQALLIANDEDARNSEADIIGVNGYENYTSYGENIFNIVGGAVLVDYCCNK